MHYRQGTGGGGDSWLLSKKENKEPQEHSGLSIPFTPVTHNKFDITIWAHANLYWQIMWKSKLKDKAQMWWANIVLLSKSKIIFFVNQSTQRTQSTKRDNNLPLISRSLNFASSLCQVHHVNKCSRVFLDLSLLLTATSYANVCNFHSCIT